MEIKNGIIINGVLHELVRTEDNNCNECSLCDVCYTTKFDYDKLCDIKFTAGIRYRFINRGKVNVVKVENENDSRRVY